MATKAESNEKITALYCRLSVEDIKDDNGKKKEIRKMSRTVSAIKSRSFRTMLKSTGTRIRCFSWMTAFRVRALTVVILTVFTEWWRKVKSARLS